jgi:predicted RNA-binding protein
MCEANIYMTDAGIEEGDGVLVLEAVDRLLPEGVDTWRAVSIFGEQKIISGRIKSMRLVEHRIVFERV